MELSGRRVVVTGGAGFIGSHVVDELVGLGADVVAFDDLSVGSYVSVADACARGARLVVGDIRDDAQLDAALRNVDVVLHMACDNLRASLADPLRSQDVNSTGTLKVALSAVRHRIGRFVYVSSSEAYGSASYVPMDEEHPFRPTTVYGAAKASGELLARSCMLTYGLPVTIVRPFNTYGPREHAEGTSAEVIPRFVSRILNGLPPVIFGDGSQTRDFTWVGDTAKGIVKATASDVLVGDTINIARGVEVSVTQVARLLLDLLDADDLQPEHLEPRPGDVARHLASAEKARRVLGFEATTAIEEGLHQYVTWLREHGDGAEGAPADVRNW